MRFTILLFSLIFFTSCTSKKNYQKPNWLLGKWVRTNSDKNKSTYEFWNDNFTGLGFTLEENDTTFIEKMSFVKNNDDLFLQIVGVGENPTFFSITKQSENAFTAENDKNQFPKKIEYTIEQDTLKAIISNDEFAVDFSFVKMEE